MQVIDITTPQEMTDAVQFIKKTGHTIFDIETESLFFKDDILSIQLMQDDICYYLAFDSIPRLRKAKPHYPKKVAKPKSKKAQEKEVKASIKQFALFDLNAYTVNPLEGIIDDNLDDFFEDVPTEAIPEVHLEGEYTSTFLSFEQYKSYLIDIFSDSDVKKIAHNMKFDAKLLLFRDIEVKNWYFDTMLACWQFDEDRMFYDLKGMWNEVKEDKSPTFKQLTRENYYWNLTDSKMREYSCGDVEKTEYFWRYYEPLVRKESWEFFEWQMMRVCETTAHMEMSGFLVDAEYAMAKTAEYQVILEEKNAIIYHLIEKAAETCGFDIPNNFSITSNPQLAVLFYDLFKYKLPMKDGKEVRSTDKHILKKWADNGSGISQNLLEYRKVEALNKFIDGTKKAGILTKMKSDGRVYPTFNQHRTSVHRYSSSDPNFQNFPREKNGVRECFVAGEGKKLFCADYSQIELRCAAYYSRDPHYLTAYMGDDTRDIHEMTRVGIVAPTFPELDGTEQRTLAKNVNFGITYGAGVKAIMDTLKCTHGQAKRIIAEHRSYYHVYTDWVEQIHSFVEENHWVGNNYGGTRRFRIDGLWKDLDSWKDAFFKREAVHFVVSSTASCIIKDRMNKIDKQFYRNPQIKMVSQVHDELIFEVDEDFDCMPIVEIMESEDGIFDIPLIVDWDYKYRWTK